MFQRLSLRNYQKSSSDRLRELVSESLTEVYAGDNAQPLTEYKNRPLAFFREIWGIELWGKQLEILYKIYGPAGCDFTLDIPGTPENGWDETWVTAGHGVGKTFFVSLLAEYHFSVLGYCVLTTAPTSAQVHDLVWQQGLATNRLKAEQRGFKLPGRLLETDVIKIAGRPDWYCKGRSTDKPERAQGRHVDNLLIILDECAGVPRPMVNAYKGYFTNAGVKMVGIGNPNSDLTSPFAEACHERRGDVGVVEIDCHECPYVAQKWIDARKKEWGEGSYEYLTKVLGRWPKDSDSKIIPMDWIKAARDFWFELEADPDDWIELTALDVAREGADKNAFVYLKGQKAYVWRYWDQPRTDLGAAEVFADLRSLARKPRRLMVDANAVGGGAVDSLRGLMEESPSALGDCELVPVDWSGAADDPKQFNRKIDELYWRLRLRLNPEGDRSQRIAIPPDSVLTAMGINLTFDKIAGQLNARKYHINGKGRIQVESKKELRKRKVPSPDVADAIALLMDDDADATAPVGFF